MRTRAESSPAARNRAALRRGAEAFVVALSLGFAGVAQAQKFAPQPSSTIQGDTFGLHVMGEVFPSVHVPVFDSQTGETLDHQEAGYFGLRFSFPIYRYKYGRVAPYLPGLLGEVDLGYTAAGQHPGKGDDGLAVGGGLELRWQLPRTDNNVMPFIRFEYDHRVTQFADISEGTLFAGAFTVALGAHLLHAIDLHLLLGGTYATGTAAGFGLGFGYLF